MQGELIETAKLYLPRHMNSCDACDFFHSPQNGREVLLITASQFFGVDVKRGFCGRHGHPRFRRRLQNQFEVFIHQAEWELRTVIVGPGFRQLSHMSRSDHSCLR